VTAIQRQQRAALKAMLPKAKRKVRPTNKRILGG
jgi:hypothetical protein